MTVLSQLTILKMKKAKVMFRVADFIDSIK